MNNPKLVTMGRTSTQALDNANQGMENLVKYLGSEDGDIIMRVYKNMASNDEIDSLLPCEMRIVLRLRILAELMDDC